MSSQLHDGCIHILFVVIIIYTSCFFVPLTVSIAGGHPEMNGASFDLDVLHRRNDCGAARLHTDLFLGVPLRHAEQNLVSAKGACLSGHII